MDFLIWKMEYLYLRRTSILKKQKISSKREDFLLVFVAGSRIELETSGL